MKLDTLKDRLYYLKTSPSEYMEFRLKYIDGFKDYKSAHVFKLNDITSRKLESFKPLFSTSLVSSMSKLIDVDGKFVTQERICIDDYNELYLIIYISSSSMSDKIALEDDLGIVYDEDVEYVAEQKLKEKFFDKYFGNKSEKRPEEKPTNKTKENKAVGGSDMEMKLDVNAMIQVKALDKILGDGKITNGKLMKMSMIIESTGGKLTDLAKTKIMAKFFSENTEDMDVEKLMLFKQLNEGHFDPAEIMQFRMMNSIYDSLGDVLDEDADPKKK